MLTTKSDAAPPPVTLGGGNQFYAAAVGSVIQAGSGSDTIDAAGGGVTVTSALGQYPNSTLSQSANLVFIGGTQSSQVLDSGEAPGLTSEGGLTVFGGSGGGTFQGAGTHDLFVSQGGKGVVTTINALGNQAVVIGSAFGTDIITAYGSGQTVTGGGGETFIESNGGNHIQAGSGNTSLYGGNSGDTVTGGAGKLTAYAYGSSHIVGGSGTVNVYCFPTRYFEPTATDTVTGGSGSLTITENNAYLIVTGGSGALNLTVGSKDAKVIEGSGKSTYDVIKGEAGGSDNLYGFKVGTDKIDLNGYTQSMVKTTVDHGNTYLTLSDNTRIALMGVTTSNLGHSLIFG